MIWPNVLRVSTNWTKTKLFKNNVIRIIFGADIFLIYCLSFVLEKLFIAFKIALNLNGCHKMNELLINKFASSIEYPKKSWCKCIPLNFQTVQRQLPLILQHPVEQTVLYQEVSMVNLMRKERFQTVGEN